MNHVFIATLVGVSIATFVETTGDQAPASPYTPRQADRPSALEGDEPGFRPIFDGRTLDGWEGDPTFWRVEGGALVGEITAETLIESNTFIIWRGGRPKDFELKLEYRITTEGNSGVNYRSTVVSDPVTPANRFAMRGYQFDLDGRRRYVGNNYEEKGRLFLAVRGQITRVIGTRRPVIVSSFGEADALATVATDDWNTAHISARGNTLMHALNGRLMSIVIDDDAANRPVDGLIGVQVHTGPPMQVEYRNIRLKHWQEPATSTSPRQRAGIGARPRRRDRRRELASSGGREVRRAMRATTGELYAGRRDSDVSLSNDEPLQKSVREVRTSVTVNPSPDRRTVRVRVPRFTHQGEPCPIHATSRTPRRSPRRRSTRPRIPVPTMSRPGNRARRPP